MSKQFSDDEESIFLNKTALIFLIILIIWGIFWIYLTYNTQISDITLEKNNLLVWWINQNVVNVTKQEFIDKVNSRGTYEAMKSLEQFSDGEVKLCNDSVCFILKDKFKYSYKKDVNYEKEYFKKMILSEFNITESQFNSFFKNEDEFILKYRYFSDSFLDTVYLEDNSNYYLLVLEKYEERENLFLRKNEFLENLKDTFSKLWGIWSLETQLKIDSFNTSLTNVLNSFSYNSLYTIPKSTFETKSKLDYFLETYGDSEKVTDKNLEWLDLIKNKDFNFEKFHQLINHLFISSTIDQLFEKSKIVIDDKKAIELENRKKLQEAEEKIKTNSN